MANGKKVKSGKKAIKDLAVKDAKAQDARGGYLQYTLKNVYVTSYHL